MTRLLAMWVALGRATRTVSTVLRHAARTLGRGLAWLFGALVGRMQWEPPVWARWTAGRATATGRHLRAHPGQAAGLAAGLAAAAGGLYWYSQLPTPHYVAYTVEAPGLTEYDDTGISSIKPLRVVFAEPAAALKLIEKPVTEGLALSPAVPGTWTWADDKTLVFTPKQDWPVAGEFSVEMDRRLLFAREVQLEDYEFDFATAAFTAEISESTFYQDPKDPALKKLVATVRFSHPVDTARFESRVTLATARDAEYLGLTPDSRHFTVAYDKFRLSAYVHSAALAMPKDDTPLTLNVDGGVRAARGGNDTPERLQAVVTVPGRTSLRFSDASMTVVDNARFEPEQVLLMTSSSPVAERALVGAVTVRLLPERHPKQPAADRNPYAWQDPDEIGQDILKTAAPVPLAYVASDEAGGTAHGFRFTAPVGRYLHVVVKDGVQGVGGYLSGKPFVATLQVEPYPQALTFLGDGALLSLSGDRQVGFLVRDVEHVEVEIARVLPNQLQHVAPTIGQFARPSIYSHLENQLVERFTTKRAYTGRAPGKPVYDSIDVGRYLQDATQGRRGLFLLHLRATTPDAGESEDGESGGEGDGGDYEDSPSLEDTRLILVTDLGLIVKLAKDGTRDVFVQSIRTGLPVDGARVEVLGVNGQPVLSATTDAGGRAQLAAFTNLRREKRPLMVLAQKDADMSFLPFSADGRELDLSRFDTGGIDNAASARDLSAYLYSDRGIYRPGETTHLGVIVRSADWKPLPAGLPIVVTVTDPRGVVVSRTDLKLSPAAFEDVTYTSQPSSPTGTYQAEAAIVKDAANPEPIGSTSFTLQEFEPDRMKVRLDLSAGGIEGWLRPEDVQARAHADLLFGAPAAARRVEGELSLTSVLPRFARYPDHRFQIGEVISEPYQETLTAAVTDAQGDARFDLDLKRFVGRAYRLNLLVRVFEAEGGRNVAAQHTAIVSEAPYLIGVKADGDLSFVPRGAARSAHWLAVNQRLAPVATDPLTLEWVQRKYVSVLTRQGNGTLRYVSQLRETVRDSKPARLAAGGTALPLPTQEPGDFALVLRNAAGTELNRLGYSVAGDANLSRSLERNTELQVQLDKPAYSGGDTIAVAIRAPYTGAGLITVERDRVFHHAWFKTTTTSSVQRITLPAGFEGNGYVSVQFLRDPASDQIFMSPLAYGVAPFAANLAARTVAVTMTAPKQVRPGAPLAIRLTTPEPSRVALIAVDEGILQVARYRNPDPLAYFFQKRRLEVETKQILDLLLPDFKRFQALAAPGGDADAGFARHLNPFNRKRKAPAAFWSGIVDVGPGGREIRYTVPDYFNGRLRLVAVAVTPTRMGVADGATEVKGDFILSPNVPAMVAPGDELLVSVGVFNNASGQGPIRLEVQPGKGLTLAGPAGVDLTIAPQAEGVAEFRLKANPVLGAASITFVARRGTASARMEESISVRPVVPYRTHLTLGRFDGSTTVPLTRTMFSERRRVEAALSALPLAWGHGLTAYLGDYEYSCTEQLVSKGVAALVLATRPELGTALSRTGPRPLDATLTVLRGRANGSGGFGLWTSTPETAEFPTIYSAHFLVEAKERGQAVPADLLAGVNNWLTQFASTPASTLEAGRQRAYATYLLARQGIKPTAAIANVEQELTRRHAETWKTDLAAAYLASTYRLMQRTADAEKIVAAVPWSPKTTGDPALQPHGEVYYDPVVHDAQLLYLTARHFPARLGRVPPAAIDGLGAAVSANRLHSLSAAYTLLALDAYAKASTTGATFGVAEVGADGKPKPLAVPAGSLLPRVAISEAARSLQLSRTGGQGATYYAVDESGFDRNVPAAEIAQGIEIVREFVDTKGAVVTRVRVGEEFFVRLRLRTTSRDRLEQVAVVDLLPGGTEPVVETQRTADSSEPGDDPANAGRGPSALPVGVPGQSTWTPQHVDLRDDRLVLYGAVTRSAAAFVYRVRATNAGTFQAPPAFAEGMYQRTITGLSKTGTLEIVKP
jgi:alpha-2-macroglobulin